jgi:putative radical SAM enzyme (TIGR03279 family)
MIKITGVTPGSIAHELNIRPNDILHSINGHEINDRLDYRFNQSEEEVEVAVKRDDETIIYEIEKDADEDIGLVLEEMEMMACGNNCVFCFVYQNPKGMRKTLYFKDEDYRYSFMYGHYVTMTTMTHKDLERVVEQRLSPLYISVHSTEEKTRKFLLGIKKDDHLLEKMKFLTGNGIELNTQIVLTPGVNDGEVFDKTISDLKQFYPGVKSVAVVPIGLTRHRERLTPLRIHTQKELLEMITFVNERREKLKRELGNYFIYLSDEFFIKARQPLPAAYYYDEFYQIENGVGEFRDMIDSFEAHFNPSATNLPEPVRLTLVTGMLAAKMLEEKIVNPLRNVYNLEIEVVPVINKWYGPSIQVSGLLVAGDIYDQLKGKELGDLVLLPPRVLNEDGFFLDDWTVDKLSAKLGTPCHVYTGRPENLAEEIARTLSVENKFQSS